MKKQRGQIGFLALMLLGVTFLQLPYSVSAVSSTSMTGSEFADLRIRPNPWRSDRDSSMPQVNFEHLPVSSSLKLFTVSGHLVRTLEGSGDSIPWDLKNSSGDRVASGIYLYVLTSQSGQKTTGKIVVIK